MGWTTVVFYFAASLACFAACRVRIRDKRVWIILAFFLLFLGLNKQLDLQSPFTAIGRCIAQIQGWYGERRVIQMFFILALLCLGAFVLALTVYRLRRKLHRVGLAILGLGFLITFVAVRAVSFHHFDQFINGYTSFGVRTNWLMELSGILLILVNALAAIAGRRRRNHDYRTAGFP